MKRKYLSALLMGALTIASVSTFTSCKDYDDDINMNTSQIKDLQEQLKTIVVITYILTMPIWEVVSQICMPQAKLNRILRFPETAV